VPAPSSLQSGDEEASWKTSLLVGVERSLLQGRGHPNGCLPVDMACNLGNSRLIGPRMHGEGKAGCTDLASRGALFGAQAGSRTGMSGKDLLAGRVSFRRGARKEEEAVGEAETGPTAVGAGLSESELCPGGRGDRSKSGDLQVSSTPSGDRQALFGANAGAGGNGEGNPMGVSG
jgi:hypothetical protein